MRFPLGIYQVEGVSMMPAFHPGQRVVVYRWSKGRVGEVIVLKKNATTMIKRIKKINGPHVDIQGDHQASTDSRSFGSVHRSQIIGKVLF